MSKPKYTLAKKSVSVQTVQKDLSVSSDESVFAFLSPPPEELDWEEVEHPEEGKGSPVAQAIPDEKPLVGLKKIAEFMNWSHDKAKRNSKELQKKRILIKQLKGKPPNRRWVIKAYPSRLMAYEEEESK